MQIIRESEEIGPAAVCRKYEITHSLFYRWKNQFNTSGIEGLQGKRFKTDPSEQDEDYEAGGKNRQPDHFEPILKFTL